MAKLIGGAVTVTVTPTSIYDLLVTATLVTAAREDPMFVKNLSIQADAANGVAIWVGNEDLTTIAQAMVVLIPGASLAEILCDYHVNLKAIYLGVSAATETAYIMGLQ